MCKKKTSLYREILKKKKERKRRRCKNKPQPELGDGKNSGKKRDRNPSQGI